MACVLLGHTLLHSLKCWLSQLYPYRRRREDSLAWWSPELRRRWMGSPCRGLLSQKPLVWLQPCPKARTCLQRLVPSLFIFIYIKKYIPNSWVCNSRLYSERFYFLFFLGAEKFFFRKMSYSFWPALSPSTQIHPILLISFQFPIITSFRIF